MRKFKNNLNKKFLLRYRYQNGTLVLVSDTKIWFRSHISLNGFLSWILSSFEYCQQFNLWNRKLGDCWVLVFKKTIIIFEILQGSMVLPKILQGSMVLPKIQQTVFLGIAFKVFMVHHNWSGFLNLFELFKTKNKVTLEILFVSDFLLVFTKIV